ncbi:hypothetical protein HDV00_003751 [Rhizophlyctis rosea]|nr:hypothetical protein HDV00_003751 [Rhizophlyctis rosea]
MLSQKRGAKRSNPGDAVQRRPNKQRKVAGGSTSGPKRGVGAGGPANFSKGKGKGKAKQSKKSIYDVYEDSDPEEGERRILARRGGGGGAPDRVMDMIDNYNFEGVEIDEEDDEELDEDEAFGESDEEKYGSFFDGATSKKHKSNVNVELDLNEDVEPEGDDGEDEDEDEDMEEDDEEYDSDEIMDLSDMLNDKPSASKKAPARREVDNVLLPNDMEEDDDDEVLDDDEGEEEDEEEEEEEDDLRGLEVDGEEEGTRPSEDIPDFTTFIKSLDAKKQASEGTKRKRAKETTEAFEESEYNLPARNVYSGESTSRKVDLGDLMEAIAGETSFGGLKKQLEGLEKAQKGKFATAQAPLPKRVQDRHEREAAYQQTKKEVSKWEPIVKKNREADHLNFAANEPQVPAISSGGLVSQFKATNDMEKEVQAILQEASLVDKKQQELEALELNRVSKEELMERRAELARMRSLLFFQEKKQKKIAKIKSKVYRKIHKKDKLKEDISLEELKRLDPELARAEAEKLDAQRAIERVSLKHKNSGKWAKQMLGKHVDTDTRRAISDQLEQHEALKRKIRGLESDESESDLVESEDEDPETARANALKALGVLEKEVDEAEAGAQAKGIFGMKFMRRGLEQQMKESREQVRMAMEDLEGEDMDGGESGEDEEIEEEETGAGKAVHGNAGRMVFGGSDKKPAKRQIEAEESDEEGDTAGQQGTTFSAQASGPIRIASTQKSTTVKIDPIFPGQQFEVEEVSESVFIGNANKRQLETSQSVTVKSTKKAVPVRNSISAKPPADLPSDSDDEPSFTASTGPSKSAKAGRTFGDDASADVDNPWLQGDDDVRAVKKSTKMVNDMSMSKTDRQIEKLSRGRKNARNAELEQAVAGVALDLGGVKALERKVDGDGSKSAPQLAAPTSKPVAKAPPKPSLPADDSDEDSDLDEAAAPKMVHSSELKSLSRNELLKMAFSGDDVAAEFANEKEDMMELDKPKEEDLTLPGWGSWGGTGLKAKKKVVVKAPKAGDGVEAEKRQDAKLKHVIINEKRMKKATKYMVPQLPHGFDTLEQYERTIRLPLGREWNATAQHKEMVKPRVQTKVGHVIAPLTMPGGGGGKRPGGGGAGGGGPKKSNPRPRKL